MKYTAKLSVPIQTNFDASLILSRHEVRDLKKPYKWTTKQQYRARVKQYNIYIDMGLLRRRISIFFFLLLLLFWKDSWVIMCFKFFYYYF